MRQADAFKFLGVAEPGSLYVGSASSAEAFRRFLARIENKNRAMLPAWWSAEKAEECVTYGEGGGEWSSLKKKVDKDGVMGHYGDERVRRRSCFLLLSI